MQKFFIHLLTGLDNRTYDLGRVSHLSGLLVFYYNAISACYQTGIFNMQEFGVGFGALCGGVGVLLKLKEGSEPKE